MKRLRKVIFWCHLATGASVAVVVLLMAVTGVLLAFERQITGWVDTRDLDGRPPMPAAERLGAEAILAAVQELEGTPISIRWHADAEAPVAVSYGRDRSVFVNAYTGAVLGTENESVRAFFDLVLGWHRWLGLENRSFGRAVTGVCNLGFLFLIVSGFYLWWPRNWRPSAVRNVTLFRRGLSPKARNFNWHNVIGFWSLVPLFVIVVSGVVISFPWASDLVYALASEWAPIGQRQGHHSEAQGEVPARTGANGRMELDLLVDRAAARVPDWRTLELKLPAPADSIVTFEFDRGTGGQPQKRAQLTLDQRTGGDVRWEPFEAGSPGQRVYSMLRFSHTGEVLGLFGQALAGLVSLGTTLLVWTGLSLAWRRYRTWRRRRQSV